MDTKMITAAAVALVIVGGGSFYEGTKYAGAGRGQGQFFSQGAGGGQGQRGRFASGAGFVGGTIVAVDAQSITVQLGGPNASSTNSGATGSKIVLYNPSTQVGKFVTGAAVDLKVGDMVTVQGNQNSDGSVTANMIQIRPEGMGGFGPGGNRERSGQ